MVGVVTMTILLPLRTFWNAPASWSAWQWVRIMPTIMLERMPSRSRVAVEKGGGSIIIPRPFIHRT